VLGGRIKNVLVESKDIASQLLKSLGNSSERITFVPLREIDTNNCVNKEHIAHIDRLTEGGAKLAIDLIDYDPKFEKAMMFFFGNTFVCDTTEIALRVIKYKP